MHLDTEVKLNRFLKSNGGQPIGSLAKRSAQTGMFDCVTANGKSTQTGKPLPKGTEVKLWSGEIVVI